MKLIPDPLPALKIGEPARCTTTKRALTNLRTDLFMAKPSLTAARLRELLSYDPATGVFIRLTYRDNGLAVGSQAGHLDDGYMKVRVDGSRHKCHRLAFLYMTGEWPKEHVDHINGQRADNRWCNLREVSMTGNVQNQRAPRKDNTTGFLGVSWHKKDRKFVACIGAGGKSIHLGNFDDPKVAHEAYLVAKRRLHPSCTI